MTGSGAENQREHPRKENPFKASLPPVITMDMPGLTGYPLSPEDFSEAGFKAMLPVPVEEGAVFPCAVHVREDTVLGFNARVAWVKEIRGLPPAWEVGFALEISDLERKTLKEMLSITEDENGG